MKRLKINSSIYEIRYVDEVKIDGVNDLLQGALNRWDKVIEIKRDLGEQARKQTIAHEAVHGILDEASIALSERTVERLANMLYGFMIDNKEFIREIVK